MEVSDSEKVEKANHILKKILAKLCQETRETWLQLLSIALLMYRAGPKSKVSTFEQLLYRRPFLTSEYILTQRSRNNLNIIHHQCSLAGVA